MKTILRFFFWIILALIVALLLVPFIFKDRVIAEIKTVINEQINAESEFSSANLSLISSFPDASVTVNDLVLNGVDQFEGTQLLKAKQIEFSMGLMTVFQDGPIKINRIYIEDPEVNIIIDKNGKANYDILKSESSTDSENEMTANLESYEIKNGSIRYLDLVSGMDAELVGVNHEGSGKFSSTVFDLETSSDIKSITTVLDKIPYLKNAKLKGKVNLNVDLNQKKYTLQKNDLVLNNLALVAVGNIQEIANGYAVDLDIDAPNAAFKDVFSLIPSAFTKDYANIKASGTAQFSGQVKGKYTENGTYPAIDFKILTKEGFVQYPGFSEAISAINLDMALKANRPDWNDLIVDIPAFSFKIANEEFNGKLKLLNALSNFDVDGYLKGKLDLSNLHQAFPVEDLNQMKGIADLDLKFKANKDQIANKNYNAMVFEGYGKLDNFSAQYGSFPSFNIQQAKINADPSSSDININRGQFGNSDFDIKASIENPLSLTNDQPTNAKMDLTSNLIDYNEWISDDTDPDSNTAKMDSFSESIIKNTTIAYTANIKKVNYEDYDIENVNSKGKITADEFTINKGTMDFSDARVDIDGGLNNTYDYIFNNETLEGDVSIKSDVIDLNKMYPAEQATEDEIAIVELPKDMDINIMADINKIIYGKYDFTDIYGGMQISNGIADFKNVAMKALGGDMKLNGFYDSAKKTRPEFEIDYNLSEVSFEDLYEVSNSFRLLAPIAQFINGKLNSTLSMKGPLNEEMMPVLNEISADGFLETINGSIEGFKPLSAIANKIGVDKLKNITVENTKNWFTVEQGAVILKPHDYEYEGMKFNFGGKHYIDQNIDYTIKAEIPRSEMKANVATNVAESGMSFIENEARKRGVDVDLGDFVYLDIKLTGSFLSPKVKVIPTGSGGKSAKQIIKDEIGNQVDVIKDTIQKEAVKKANQVKDSVTKVVTKKTDEVKIKVKTKVYKEVETAKEKAKEKVKEVIDSTITGKVLDTISNKVGDKVGEVLGDKAKEEADKLKDKLKDFNPFKKKN